jgi:hypothetical protein
VFAGYEEKDYFPRLIQYSCYGVLLGRLLCIETHKDDTLISHQNISGIRPIAQSDMVNTFIYGASMDALVEIDEIFVKALDEFTSALAAAGIIGTGVDMYKQKEDAKNRFTDKTTEHLSEVHSRPLRQVIGMLSIPELAELAETLISIESLKERVTRPTESVSGPIDVAVITKSDGFIWIKRKHYFDPKLNPRFFVRRGVQAGA